MTILEKLSFSNKTRTAMLTSPEAKLLGKMLETLDLQIKTAKATLNGAGLITPPGHRSGALVGYCCA